MSSPKEKAVELYNKYEQLGKDFTRGVSMAEFAKQCALIAVDEILNSNYKNTLTDLCYKFTCNELDNYLEEVKKEIEKL